MNLSMLYKKQNKFKKITIILISTNLYSTINIRGINMQRQIINDLIKWKETKNRKPLIFMEQDKWAKLIL